MDINLERLNFIKFLMKNSQSLKDIKFTDVCYKLSFITYLKMLLYL